MATPLAPPTERAVGPIDGLRQGHNNVHSEVQLHLRKRKRTRPRRVVPASTPLPDA